MPPFGYHESSQPSFLQNILRKRKVPFIIGLAFVAVLLVTFSNKGLLRRILLEREVREKEEKVVALRQEIRDLNVKRDMLLYDTATIEQVAREAHGMILPCEVVYRIVPSDTTASQ
ncbi:MAG: septum formation initiator family protein [Bacteroidota bacterium]|nr:septum formation initiator family protein [Bacteroidota bacterium]